MKCEKCAFDVVNGKCLCKDKRVHVSIGENWTEERLREYCLEKGIHKTTDHFKKMRELLR